MAKSKNDVSIGDWEPKFYAKFLDLVNADDAANDLAAAIAWVMSNIERRAAGTECPLRSVAKVKESIAKGAGSCLTSGSLSQLNLTAAAVSTMDTGKIGFLLQEYTTHEGSEGVDYQQPPRLGQHVLQG